MLAKLYCKLANMIISGKNLEAQSNNLPFDWLVDCSDLSLGPIKQWQHHDISTRQQNTAKQHHTTEYRKDLHLLSAPVSQWGRWGGGRSSFRWLLLEDREFQRVRQRDRDKGGRGEERNEDRQKEQGQLSKKKEHRRGREEKQREQS